MDWWYKCVWVFWVKLKCNWFQRHGHFISLWSQLDSSLYLSSTMLSRTKLKTEWLLLTLTMDSFVWAISEITPSVTIRSTKYWEPSFTEEAYLKGKKKVKITTENKTVPLYVMVTKYNLKQSTNVLILREYLNIC